MCEFDNEDVTRTSNPSLKDPFHCFNYGELTYEELPCDFHPSSPLLKSNPFLLCQMGRL